MRRVHGDEGGRRDNLEVDLTELERKRGSGAVAKVDLLELVRKADDGADVDFLRASVHVLAQD